MPDPATLIQLAHTGHWAIWVLYAVPVLAVLAAVLLGSIRARREDAEASRGTEAGGPPREP